MKQRAEAAGITAAPEVNLRNISAFMYGRGAAAEDFEHYLFRIKGEKQILILCMTRPLLLLVAADKHVA
eukprot:2469830-Pleurochrysis_carterae.AAC.1